MILLGIIAKILDMWMRLSAWIKSTAKIIQQMTTQQQHTIEILKWIIAILIGIASIYVGYKLKAVGDSFERFNQNINSINITLENLKEHVVNHEKETDQIMKAIENNRQDIDLNRQYVHVMELNINSNTKDVEYLKNIK